MAGWGETDPRMDWAKTKGWGWLVLGAGCLAAAVVLTAAALRAPRSAAAAPPTVPVVVAARAVPAMSPLAPADVVVRRFPAALAPSGALRGVDALKGAWTLVPLAPGAPVLAAEVARPGRDPLVDALLAPHEQAVGVSLAAAAAAGGFVTPGSRVNLYAVSAQRSTEIAAGVRVLAVNGSLVPAAGPPGGATELLTLAVPDPEVPAVLEAQAAGALVATLARGG